jgi:hypothetical protein
MGVVLFCDQSAALFINIGRDAMGNLASIAA